MLSVLLLNCLDSKNSLLKLPSRISGKPRTCSFEIFFLNQGPEYFLVVVLDLLEEKESCVSPEIELWWHSKRFNLNVHPFNNAMYVSLKYG